MKSPYPFFGGKSRPAALVWERLGDVPNYVEPFMGSAAVLLGRPHEPRIETVNDKDGLVANFWRALKDDPQAVAHYADWPVNENDLHARHAWLVGRKERLQARLEGDPDFYDAKIAGWWVWGMACWIGGGFCSGEGPWVRRKVNGVWKLVHLGNAGQGVKRKLVHLGNAGQGVNRQLVHLADAGRGVQRKRVQLHNDQGIFAGDGRDGLLPWMLALAERMERVRVCCGDWARVCTPSVTWRHGLTGVFLDPPYSGECGRDNAIYTCEDLSVSHQVREWCLENGDHPKLRIALCGYQGEHEELESHGWRVLPWKAQGGMGNQGRNGSAANVNRHRERIWFSPTCLLARKEARCPVA